MQWFINVGFTPVEIITTIIFATLLIIPAYKVLERIGINGWLSVLVIIPFVSIIALWVVAFVRWPSDSDEIKEEGQPEEAKNLRKSETTAENQE